MRQAYSKLGVRDENSFANHHEFMSIRCMGGCVRAELAFNSSADNGSVGQQVLVAPLPRNMRSAPP